MAETLFEPGTGGLVYDRRVDGSSCIWARVLAHELEHRNLDRTATLGRPCAMASAATKACRCTSSAMPTSLGNSADGADHQMVII
jgi:hypothetical protein